MTKGSTTWEHSISGTGNTKCFFLADWLTYARCRSACPRLLPSHQRASQPKMMALRFCVVRFPGKHTPPLYRSGLIQPLNDTSPRLLCTSFRVPQGVSSGNVHKMPPVGTCRLLYTSSLPIPPQETSCENESVTPCCKYYGTSWRYRRPPMFAMFPPPPV